MNDPDEPLDESTDVLPVTWVEIAAGSDRTRFTGAMSCYPTTNAQYARYLNDALAAGSIMVDEHLVRGVGRSHPDEDFIGQEFFRLDGPGWTAHGAINGGASRIHRIDETFQIDSGFENHPVTYVSWYGAAAFCHFYGWRLPEAGEWEVAAGCNGAFTYGTGDSLQDADGRHLANYRDCIAGARHGTTPVDHFGTFGYGLADMAGNVWDWTNTASGHRRLLCGGAWSFAPRYCTVTSRLRYYPTTLYCILGFRACR